MSRDVDVLLYMEQALQNIVGIDESGSHKPFTVSLDRPTAMTRDEAPGVNIKPNTEDLQHFGGADQIGRETVQSRLRIDVEVYVRGDQPSLLASKNFAIVHARLLKDRTFGGLARAVRITNKRWLSAPADEHAGWLVAGYDVIYHAYDTDLA